MANYRAAIKRAIVAAGLKITEFEVHSTGFELDWQAVGLAGATGTLPEEVKAINRGNCKLRKVAKALKDAGYTVTTRTARWGGMFAEVNEYRHSGHEADYSDKSSVMHY